MRIQILTGPPGAGKNTISHLLAKKRRKCAVIDVDVVRWMVLQPHRPPWQEGEGQKQRILGVKNACLLARNFLEEGYDVAILDVIYNETIGYYRNHLKDLHPEIILLLPTLEETKWRNTQRPPRLDEKEIEMLYASQVELRGFDKKIDNTFIPAEEMAEMLV